MNNFSVNTNYNTVAERLGQETQKAAQSTPSGFSSIFQQAVKATGSASPKNSLDEIFERASAQYRVPQSLLKAVAKVESGFDADAVSRCGAQGIMQLMPGTAASLGVENALDPEQNIMGGAKYLSQLLERYDGNPVLALAAYNAGSGNVAKYGGVPPFAETQKYVSLVMNYAGLKPADSATSLNTLIGGNSSGSEQLSAANSLFGKASLPDKLAAMSYFMTNSSDNSTSQPDSLLGNPIYNQLAGLGTLLGNSSDSFFDNRFKASENTSLLNSLLGTSSSMDQLEALGALLGASSGNGEMNGSLGSAGLGLSSQQYASLLQILVGQMQMNSNQRLASDLSDALDDSSSI